MTRALFLGFRFARAHLCMFSSMRNRNTPNFGIRVPMSGFLDRALGARIYIRVRRSNINLRRPLVSLGHRGKMIISPHVLTALGVDTIRVICEPHNAKRRTRYHVNITGILQICIHTPLRRRPRGPAVFDTQAAIRGQGNRIYLGAVFS
jgi:hypothetical protein